MLRSRDLPLSAFYFLYFCSVGVFAPYFSLYLQQGIGLSSVEIGLLLALLGATRVTAPLALGRRADRPGRRVATVRWLMVLGACVWTGVALSGSFWSLAVALTVYGLLVAAALPAFESITLLHVRKEPGRYGPIRVWGSVGFIVTVFAAGAALDAWSVAMVPWAILAILAAVALSTLAVAEPPAAQVGGDEAPLARLLTQPGLVTLFAACALMAVAHGPFYGFYTIHLAASGYAKSAIGALWSLGVLAEIGVFLAMPWLLRRARPEMLLRVAFGCAVLRFVVVGWMPDSAALMVAAQLLHAFTFGAHHAASVHLVSRWFGEGRSARGQVLYSSLTYGAGGMIGSLGAGALWDTAGPAWTFSAGALAAMFGLVLVMSRFSLSPPSALTSALASAGSAPGR